MEGAQVTVREPRASGQRRRDSGRRLARIADRRICMRITSRREDLAMNLARSTADREPLADPRGIIPRCQATMCRVVMRGAGRVSTRRRSALLHRILLRRVSERTIFPRKIFRLLDLSLRADHPSISPRRRRHICQLRIFHRRMPRICRAAVGIVSEAGRTGESTSKTECRRPLPRLRLGLIPLAAGRKS